MTLQTRSTCHCSSNSASSSSTSLTTSLTRIFCLRSLSPRLEDLLDRDRRVQHHLQDAPLAVLDALGDLDLALAREQRDRPHLAQVHAHRIVGLGVAVGVLLLLGLVLRLGLGLLVLVVVRSARAALSATLIFDDESTISMPSSENADSQSSI